MPSFSDSFWSKGYSSGLTILFDKLHQGCTENDEVLALAQARADAEEQYGRRLQELPFTFAPRKTGFSRDDGASLRRAYEGIVGQMGEEGQDHLQVAENIRRMVLLPFGNWAGEHRQRVDYSHGVLKQKLKKYDKEMAEVQKSQKRYFNKCRVLEDFKESGDDGEEVVSSPNIEIPNVADATRVAEEERADAQSKATTGAAVDEQNLAMEYNDPVELGGIIYSPEETQALFKRLLAEIPQRSVKVSILGTYEHVSTGADIVSFVQQAISGGNLIQAERFGQNLVNSGYLRLVGQVGSKFANSSVFNYQWRNKAFEQAGQYVPDNSFVGNYLGDTINQYINNPHPDETPEERLKREVFELDHRYKSAVTKLDDTRCNLEESIIDHLKFMERCEFDRLKAIKAVFLDFLATLSNVVPSIQSAVDKELLFQETVHPANDLRYILESYRTGPFYPKVTIYDNYYNTTEDQTFGVDLELRSRGDRKKVPFFVIAVLKHMDNQYPDLENDDVRLGAWTVSVPLNSTHRLRKELNTGKQFRPEVLKDYEAPIVASVLKLYLVELPDSIVPSQFYDIIKTIYSQHGSDEDARPRISAIQNTFSQLRVSNIATLDAILTHLTRLITITKAPSSYASQLAQELSHCILRPRTQSSLTIDDRHAFRLVQDLFTYKDQIFSGLKRNNSNSKNGTRVNSSLTESGDFSAPVRRPTLQNRLDALSLKIRKGNASNVKSQDSEEDAAEDAEGLNHEAQPQTAARVDASLTDDAAVASHTQVESHKSHQDAHGAEEHPIVID